MSDLMALPFVFPATPTVPPAQVATGLAFAARCCSGDVVAAVGLAAAATAVGRRAARQLPTSGFAGVG